MDDFKSFVSNRIINVDGACEILDCTGQNINDLIKRGKLSPVKSTGNNILLMRNEVLERKWD